MKQLCLFLTAMHEVGPVLKISSDSKARCCMLLALRSMFFTFGH